METPPPPQEPQNQPPQQPAPQPMPQAQPNYAPAGPTIRFDAIGNAFNMVFADIGTWLTGSVLAFIPIIVVSILLVIVSIALAVVGGFFGLMLVTLLRVVVAGPLLFVMWTNMCRMAMSALNGSKPSVNDVFKFEPNSTMTGLLVGLIVGVGYMFCIIPGLVLGGLLMLALPASIDRNLPAKDAINLSMELMKKEVVMASVFFLAVTFCACIGSVAFGIGIILTLGVFPLAVTMLYRDYVGFASSPLPSDAVPPAASTP